MIAVSLTVDACSACMAIGERHQRFSWSAFADIASGPLAAWQHAPIYSGGPWGLICITMAPVAVLAVYGMTRYRPALYLGAALWVGIGFLMGVAIWI